MEYCLYMESATPAMPPAKEPKKTEKEERQSKGKSEKRKIVQLYTDDVRLRITRPNTEKIWLEHVETRTVAQAEFVKILVGGIYACIACWSSH